MELKNNLKAVIFSKGYKSVRDFTEKNKLSYMPIIKLAHNKNKTIDINLLITLCEKLDCEIGDLFEVKHGQAS